MRVFIDSSVLFAMCYSKTDGARELVRRTIRSEIDLCVSEYVFAETQTTLEEKIPHKLTFFDYLQSRDFWQLIQPSKADIIAALDVTIDRFDVPIVAAAKLAHVDALASFDRKHLHTSRVERFIGARVMTPEGILKSLGNPSRLD
jgi:predicted nucleic acid-binding protein